MKTNYIPLFALLAASVLSGCAEGLVKYPGGPNALIATGHDTGDDDVGLADGEAAIVYDPDGCQGWLMDDGVEGYAGRRFDPRSGLPICDDNFPPGSVVGEYQTSTPGVRDFVPGG